MLCLSASWSMAQIAPETNPHPTDPWKLGIGGKPRPKNARTIIDAEEGAWFDDPTNTIEYSGRVAVHDPQFTLFCDKLHVVMNKNRQGLQQVIATGNVLIEQENTNDQGEVIKSIARAGEAIYEPETGDMTLKIWPQIQQGRSYQVGTEEGTIMILNNKGTSRTLGKSRATVIEPSQTP
ncbi:MAG: LptA/OstA family protein [Chthoniobacterales bacterium]